MSCGNWSALRRRPALHGALGLLVENDQVGHVFHFFRRECTERGNRLKPLRSAPTAMRQKERGLDPSPFPLLSCLPLRKNGQKDGVLRERLRKTLSCCYCSSGASGENPVIVRAPAKSEPTSSFDHNHGSIQKSNAFSAHTYSCSS